MIKTIDEAVPTEPRDMELLHRLDEPTMRCWYCGNSRAHWEYNEECQVRVRNLARQLLTENASLSSKLERARMELWLTKNNLENVALEAALIGKPMPFEILQDWVSQGIKSVSAALAETEEENISGDSGESVQS